jgi:hypothetical protein
MTEIRCPSDCPYLASAREHPPAVTLRQQQRDMGLLVHVMRDLNQRQAELLFLVLSFIARYDPPELQPLVDEDLAESAAALAATFETAARGVIYEHRPASAPAARLLAELRPVLAEAGRGAGSSFDRDAAVVFRRLEQGVRDVPAEDRDNRRAFIALLGRVIAPAPGDAASAPASPPRLIVP